MVERLSRGPASVSELARPTGLSLPAVMQHLALLESSGLVRTAEGRAGAHLPHRARRPQPSRAMDPAETPRVGARLDRLGDYLESLKTEGDDHGSSD